MSLRVMLVDDHPLFRDGIASLLMAWGMEVVGQASDGEEAIAKARELRPDLILMDIYMPGLGGLETTRTIKVEMPETIIIMLTVSDDEQDLFEAIKSGAQGYLLKNMRSEEFGQLMAGIAQGEVPMSRKLAAKIIEEFSRGGPRLATGEKSGEQLSPRESEVLAAIAGGATNREIAAALFISENTVSFHVKNILAKLHLRNRGQAIAYALRHGLGKPPLAGIRGSGTP